MLITWIDISNITNNGYLLNDLGRLMPSNLVYVLAVSSWKNLIKINIDKIIDEDLQLPGMLGELNCCNQEKVASRRRRLQYNAVITD